MKKATSFNLLSSPMEGLLEPLHSIFANEQQLYEHIHKKVTPLGWTYFRLEEKLTVGMPDILLLRPMSYCLIEAKIVHSTVLHNLADQPEWQLGQLSFLKRALRNNLRYMLVVGVNNGVWYIAGGQNGILDYADVIGTAGLV